MTTPEYKVEKWTHQPGIMVLAGDWATECGIEDFCASTAMEDIMDMNRRGDSEVFVLLCGDEVVGAMGITILDMFYTKDMYAAVRYWYIKPEHRALALKLMSTARKWALEMKCTKLLVCSNRLCSPSDNFYKALKFKEYETVYVRDV